MDEGAWWATVHGVTKSRTRLSNFIYCYFHTNINAYYFYLEMPEGFPLLTW